MPQKGDTVQVHYNGFLEDGTIFESTIAGEPFLFTIGEGRVIPGIENAILEMNEGETKTVAIPPADAYGYYDKETVTEIKRSEFPDGMEPKVGMKLKASTAEGVVRIVTVKAITEKSVTLDANHPLAGKKLTFEIHLLKIS